MSAKRRTTKEEPTEPQPTFEEAIEKLESIIDRIESGEVGLEDSLGEYEQGMKLVTRCRTILDRAQQKFAELTVDEQGGLAVDDDTDDND